MIVPALDDIAASVVTPDDHPRVLAEIHGTVELDRALVELGAVDADASGAVRPVDADASSALPRHADELIGATLVILGDRGVAVAEPSIDGRLAASLARSGEGIVGRYVEIDAGAIAGRVRARAAAAGLALTRVAMGPFGPEVLVLAGPIGSPNLLLVERRSLPSNA